MCAPISFCGYCRRGGSASSRRSTAWWLSPFCLGLLWFGVQIVTDAWGLDERSETVLAFPMWIYYSALPAGALLMSIRYVIRLYRYIFAFDPATMTIFPAHDV
jgi:TRAP-type C4-dicarboxylate transport system permease small subunit